MERKDFIGTALEVIMEIEKGTEKLSEFMAVITGINMLAAVKLSSVFNEEEKSDTNPVLQALHLMHEANIESCKSMLAEPEFEKVMQMLKAMHEIS